MTERLATKTQYVQEETVFREPTTSDVILISEDSAQVPGLYQVELTMTKEQHKSLLEEIEASTINIVRRNAHDSKEALNQQALAASLVRTIESFTIELSDPEDSKKIWIAALKTLADNDLPIDGQTPYSRIFVDAYNERREDLLRQEAQADQYSKYGYDHVPTPTAEELEDAIQHLTPEDVSPARGINIAAIAKRAWNSILLDDSYLDKKK